MRAFKKIRAVTFACAMLAAGTLSAETLVWTGEASSDWNLTDLNWTNELGEATAWVNGSSATFTECGSAALTISVTDDIQLHNLMLTRTSPAVTWNDGGGSLTFVSASRMRRIRPITSRPSRTVSITSCKCLSIARGRSSRTAAA